MDRDYEAFISYRHKECNPLAKAIHDELMEAYAINSFRDDEGLHFGDFREQLIKNNKKSKYLILLLTPETLSRCEREGDWITKEVSLFLERKKPIIPVKLQGFEFPERLPAGLEGLLEHDFRSIRCDVDDPYMAAQLIAVQVNSRLRENWDEKSVVECILRKPYLSKENVTERGYFAESANKLRNTVFYLIPTLAMALSFFFVCFKIKPDGVEFNDYWSFLSLIFGGLSFILYFLEHKKVIDEETGKPIPFSIHWTDRSEIGALSQVWGWLILFAFVGLIGSMIISFGSIILGIAVGQTVLGGITQVTDSEDMLLLCIYSTFVVIPCIRLIIKAFLELCHFLNCILSRYPERYLRWKGITKAQKIWRIVGWIILLPAVAFLAALVLGVKVV